MEAEGMSCREASDSAEQDDGWCPLLMWRLPKTAKEWQQLQSMTQLDASSEDESEDGSGTDDGLPEGSTITHDRRPGVSPDGLCAAERGANTGIAEVSAGGSASSWVDLAVADASAGDASLGSTCTRDARLPRQKISDGWAGVVRADREAEERIRTSRRREKRRRALARGASSSRALGPDDSEVDALALCVQAFAGLEQ